MTRATFLEQNRAEAAHFKKLNEVSICGIETRPVVPETSFRMGNRMYQDRTFNSKNLAFIAQRLAQ